MSRDEYIPNIIWWTRLKHFQNYFAFRYMILLYITFLYAVFKMCNVCNLLVFRLPKYASKFIEMCLMVTADHGPAVSGAHNTIVCARAGKDLISSLASGLLTIVSQKIFVADV